MITTKTGGARHTVRHSSRRNTNAAVRAGRSIGTRLMLGLSIGVLGACASQNAADSTSSTSSTASTPSPGQSRTLVTARNPNRNTNPAAPVVEASTPLGYMEPPTTRPQTDETASPWAPDWFSEGLTKPNGTLMACATAASADLLDARRQAIDSATAIFREHDDRSPGIDRTVTRQLSDGQFRVWVRVGPAS